MRSAAAVGPAHGARASDRDRVHDGDSDEDDENADETEQRRRAYLRRHREMLLQKQRLETVMRMYLLAEQQQLHLLVTATAVVQELTTMLDRDACASCM